KLGDGRLLGQIDVGDERDFGMLAQRKPIRLRSVVIWHVADRTGRDQRADHGGAQRAGSAGDDDVAVAIIHRLLPLLANALASSIMPRAMQEDRKSTRLNSSHVEISYAVFCLKKKKNFIG